MKLMCMLLITAIACVLNTEGCVLGHHSSDYCSLGVNNRSIIPDESMTSSSIFDERHKARYGRLDETPSTAGNKIAVWVPARRETGEWIQVDLGSPKIVAGIVTQGRGTTGGGWTPDQWVTSYTVSCRLYEDDNTVIMGDDGLAKVFPANSDRNTKVFNLFDKPMVCRYVRVYPQTWYAFNSMRMDIICGGCKGN